MKVAVSGGFDPLHVGHVRYIEAAAEFGRVVVILNTDRFLMEKKGFVFMPWEERAEILRSLRCVAAVMKCIDKDQTVCETLDLLAPDIFAKGGDRHEDNTPEVAVCQRNGIRMVWGCGGDKVQSSSWLVKPRMSQP